MGFSKLFKLIFASILTLSFSTSHAGWFVKRGSEKKSVPPVEARQEAPVEPTLEEKVQIVQTEKFINYSSVLYRSFKELLSAVPDSMMSELNFSSFYRYMSSEVKRELGLEETSFQFDGFSLKGGEKRLVFELIGTLTMGSKISKESPKDIQIIAALLENAFRHFIKDVEVTGEQNDKGRKERLKIISEVVVKNLKPELVQELVENIQKAFEIEKNEIEPTYKRILESKLEVIQAMNKVEKVKEQVIAKEKRSLVAKINTAAGVMLSAALVAVGVAISDNQYTLPMILASPIFVLLPLFYIGMKVDRLDRLEKRYYPSYGFSKKNIEAINRAKDESSKARDAHLMSEREATMMSIRLHFFKELAEQLMIQQNSVNETMN